MRADDLHDFVVNCGRIFAFLLHHQELRPEVGGHDDDHIAEVDGAALPVG